LSSICKSLSQKRETVQALPQEGHDQALPMSRICKSIPQKRKAVQALTQEGLD
jgi:hypothetical protein